MSDPAERHAYNERLKDDVDALAERLLVAFMSNDEGGPSAAWCEAAYKMAEAFVGMRERRRGRL